MNQKVRVFFKFAGFCEEKEFRRLGDALCWWITRGNENACIHRLLDIAEDYVVFYVNGRKISKHDLAQEIGSGVEYVGSYSNPVPILMVGNEFIRLPTHVDKWLNELRIWPDMFQKVVEAYEMAGIKDEVCNT